jgi:hypothetical protein
MNFFVAPILSANVFATRGSSVLSSCAASVAQSSGFETSRRSILVPLSRFHSFAMDSMAETKSSS